PFADFITYPSQYEGFGNAFLEAIYFKKPLLVNRYATFVRDIEPQGFVLAIMDGFLSRNTVKSVIDILESSERREKMVNYNYDVAAQHYSYSILRTQLNALLNHFFGNSISNLYAQSPCL
ncbi:MAG: glycosyltransferase, partial [Desulfobacterales bacterium]